MAIVHKIKEVTHKAVGVCPPPCRTYCGDIFTSKTVEELEADSTNTSMKKNLNFIDLTLLGIGAIIGSGIFVLTGHAAGDNAGPAIVISFIIAGITSGLAALCYAEMASMIPVAGSAYTYSYATMGELVAWIIGWDLILEYLVGAAAVSVGWSSYVTSFIEDCGGGSILHKEWYSAPFAWNDTSGGNDTSFFQGYFYLTGYYINVPAVVIVLALTALLIFGIKESAIFNGITVAIKLVVVLIFIFASIKFINTDNWKPFIPPEKSWGHYGWSGIFQATTLVFFAYIGFDAVSTTAQEARRPQRDLPIGIISSLIICTVLYIAVCLCLTGIIPYELLSGEHAASPIAKAAQHIGQRWLALVTEIGAIAGLTSVMLVSLLSQPRIFYSMARDGLFPSCAARTHPKFGTPFVTTLITGVITAILGGILPIEILSELTSVGTLFAFVLVSIGVLILRIRRPNLPRKFKIPGGIVGVWIIAVLSAACSFLLIVVSTGQTKLRLVIWMLIGFVIYFAYGKRHSVLQKRIQAERSHPGGMGHAATLRDAPKRGSFEMKATIPVKPVDPTSPEFGVRGAPPPYPGVLKRDQ